MLKELIKINILRRVPESTQGRIHLTLLKEIYPGKSSV